MDSVLHLLGIARKAGRVEVGEEPVGAAARAHQAKLILTACDGADNSLRRAAHFAEIGKVPHLPTPYTKGGLRPTPRAAWAVRWAALPAPCWPSPTWGWPPPLLPSWLKPIRSTAPPRRRS